MKYTEFKKQAEETPYAPAITDPNPGAWDWFKTTSPWIPYDASSPDYSKAKNPEERVQMFMDDTAHKAVGQLGFWGPAKSFLTPGHTDTHMVDEAFSPDRPGFIRRNFNRLRGQRNLNTNAYDAADKFIQAANPQDINALQKHMYEMESQFGKDSKNFQKFKGYVTQKLQSKVWNEVKANPLKNMPVAASMFLRQHGMGGIANIAENPVAFYGSLALALLGGGALLFGGRGGREQSTNVNVSVPAGYSRIPYS